MIPGSFLNEFRLKPLNPTESRKQKKITKWYVPALKVEISGYKDG